MLYHFNLTFGLILSTHSEYIRIFVDLRTLNVESKR